ncbi:transposase [Streptomyces sp. NPDC003077]|uniref:IS701 family transposase n=1 Tax=Streptomyces sp. NPDC003077 TaxID=3154443 RepID=UPI0033B4F066
MVTHAVTRSRTSVPAFAERIFEPLPRTDQRRWAHVYLQSLLSTPGKKSVRRLAAAVSDSPTASQSLHQFINASPWEWTPVREELARWAEPRLAPQALVVDLAVLRKRGEHSCGVHRRFVRATGRSVSCQVGIGAFLAAADEAVPVDWRLLLPGAWAKDPERRTRTRIPEHVGPRGIDQHVLDLADARIGGARVASLPVVADLSGESGAGALVRGLSVRKREFIVGVPGRLRIMAGRHLSAESPFGRPYGAAEPGVMVDARSLFETRAGGLVRIETVTPPSGRGRAAMVLTSSVRLPEIPAAGPLLNRTYRLFAVRPVGGRGPAKLWLTNMTQTRMETLLAMVRLPSRTARSVQELEEDFGLVDFEGRSFPGWHHHMTMLSAAYAFSRLGRPAGTSEVASEAGGGACEAGSGEGLVAA